MNHTIKTLTSKNRMYICEQCEKRTRAGNKYYQDAEDLGICQDCFEENEMEDAHDYAENNGQENAEGMHFPEDCPFCK